MLDVVDRSGAAAALEEHLIKRGANGKPLGRPRRLGVRAVLVAGILAALRGGGLDVCAMWRVLARLAPEQLEVLGLGDRPPTLSQVDHVWNRVAEACDAAAVSAGRRLDPGGVSPRPGPNHRRLHPEPAGTAPTPPATRRSGRGGPRPLSPQDQAECTLRLHAVCDALLAGTIPTTLDTGRLAIDWTDHETWATSYTDKVSSADPEARWGRRRPTNATISGRRRAVPDGAVPDAAQWDEGKSELFYGYNLHAAVTAGTPGAPELAVAVRVTPANAMDVGPLVIDMVDALQRRGRIVEELLVDRGYSMRSPDKLHKPLAARNVFLSFDYTIAQYGRHGTHLGAVLIGGEPHCPATPTAAVNRPRPNPKAGPGEWEQYWRDRDRLNAYAFRRLGRPVPSLTQRYECPAAAGRVRCPLRAPARPIGAGRDVPEIYDPPTTPPTCCTQRTFTVDIEVGLGYRQRHVHGTKPFVSAYDGRTSVERWFSSVKYVSRAQRENIRVLGMTRRTLMLTFAAAATNLRHVRNWEARAKQHPATGPEPTGGQTAA